MLPSKPLHWERLINPKAQNRRSKAPMPISCNWHSMERRNFNKKNLRLVLSHVNAAPDIGHLARHGHLDRAHPANIRQCLSNRLAPEMWQPGMSDLSICSPTPGRFRRWAARFSPGNSALSRLVGQDPFFERIHHHTPLMRSKNRVLTRQASNMQLGEKMTYGPLKISSEVCVMRCADRMFDPALVVQSFPNEARGRLILLPQPGI